MAAPKKHEASFYDEAYLKSPMSANNPTITRWVDNGLFFQAAISCSKLARFLGCSADSQVVDIGCGRGFIVRHLRNLGFPLTTGVEYSTAALANTVCGALPGDLTKSLPGEKDRATLVICAGVLSQLPEGTILHALREIRRVTKPGGHLITNILSVPDGEKPPGVKHEGKHVPMQQFHHLSVQPPSWWRRKFAAAGWKERTDMEPTLSEVGFNRRKEQWAAIWTKPEKASPKKRR
jgi:SAM-dependent methyltransferase